MEPVVVRGLAAQAASDHLQREVLVLLGPQDEAEPFDVGLVKLAVSRRRPLRVEQPLALEEPDLGDRQVGKLPLEQVKHLPDREVAALGHASALAPAEEHQLELADLDLVAVGDGGLVGPSRG